MKKVVLSLRTIFDDIHSPIEETPGLENLSRSSHFNYYFFPVILYFIFSTRILHSPVRFRRRSPFFRREFGQKLSLVRGSLSGRFEISFFRVLGEEKQILGSFIVDIVYLFGKSRTPVTHSKF